MNFEEVLMRYGITSEMIEKFEEMALEIRKQDDLYSTAYKTITSQIYHQFFKLHIETVSPENNTNLDGE